MVVAKPHFLLFCDASVASCARSDTDPVGGRWHFVLERIDAAQRLEAADGERAAPRERLALLAVVRGLEAIEEPSQVTLVTTSRYVARGLRYGLSEWRETGYIWEHFGVQKPIRNADLWQRIDGAMQFHEVACRLLESSLAQQQSPVTEEVAKPLELEPVGVGADSELAEPLIPAPHFPVRPQIRPTLQPKSRRHAGRSSETVEQAWQEPEFHLPSQAEPAADARPVRRAACVRSIPRPHLAGAPKLRTLAANLANWLQGRALQT